MTVDFSQSQKDLFTNIYFEVEKATSRFVVVYGGASSGKSYAVHQLEVMNIMEEGKGNTLIIRKHGSDIRESCYQLCLNILDDWGIKHLFDIRYSNDQRKITCKHTGRSIIFKGLDDSEKLKSIVGIRRIVIEEANQTEFTDFKELNRRARGIDGIQILLILNPVSENHWIKKQLCDYDSPFRSSTTVLKFTYKDNCNLAGQSFLTDDDRTQLELLSKVDENQYRIYVLGEWGIDNKEGKFCFSFDSKSQIKKTAHDPERITWATFDFNVNPMTCTIAQIFPEIQTVRALECIKLANSDIYEMCDRLLAAYPTALWTVTGDASGNNRSIMARDEMTAYKVIASKLRLMNSQIKVASVNPPLAENKLLVNAIHKNWHIEIDPDKCKPLIYDLQYVEVDEQGKIIKGENRNGGSSDTNQKKFSDFLDNWRYLLNAGVKPHFNYGRP